jgi:hypothetical protein
VPKKIKSDQNNSRSTQKPEMPDNRAYRLISCYF